MIRSTFSPQLLDKDLNVSCETRVCDYSFQTVETPPIRVCQIDRHVKATNNERYNGCHLACVQGHRASCGHAREILRAGKGNISLARVRAFWRHVRHVNLTRERESI